MSREVSTSYPVSDFRSATENRALGMEVVRLLGVLQIPVPSTRSRRYAFIGACGLSMSAITVADTSVMPSTFTLETLGAGLVTKISNVELSPGKLSNEEASTSY